MGKIANRQSLAFSERGRFSQAIPQVHVERMLNEWTPLTRCESRHNERRVYEDQFLCFRGRYDRQRTLAIRIAAITVASDSAITIARFRPSKVVLVLGFIPWWQRMVWWSSWGQTGALKTQSQAQQAFNGTRPSIKHTNTRRDSEKRRRRGYHPIRNCCYTNFSEIISASASVM